MAAVLGQMHMNAGYGWWMGIGMMVFWILVIAGVAAVVIAVTRSGAQATRDGGSKRARDLLAERYALGEIDTDEFHTRSNELEKAGR
jgi:putative membrane protein